MSRNLHQDYRSVIEVVSSELLEGEQCSWRQDLPDNYHQLASDPPVVSLQLLVMMNHFHSSQFHISRRWPSDAQKLTVNRSHDTQFRTGTSPRLSPSDVEMEFLTLCSPHSGRDAKPPGCPLVYQLCLPYLMHVYMHHNLPA